MLYEFYAIEQQVGWLEVEAENETEAFNKAIKEYENGQVEWTDADVHFEPKT